MELAGEVQRALDGIFAVGPPEVRENGEWLAALQDVRYEVLPNGETALIHLWSGDQSLVRRVLAVAEEGHDHLVLQVHRFGHGKHGRLEFVARNTRNTAREGRRAAREQFALRFRRLLTAHFPDEAIESLAASADLSRSISGSYTRGLVRRGSQAFSVLGAPPDEDGPTLDRILTYGLIWLQHSRDRARRFTVCGLRLFLPRGSSAVTARRMEALACPREIELYEYDPLHWRVRRIARSDAGNLETRIRPRREIEQIIAAAQPAVERIRCLAPDAVRIGIAPATQDVTLRFRGLEFARWRQGVIWFGFSDRQDLLTPERWPALEALVQQLQMFRHPLAKDARHHLYRAQPERWLETMVADEPSRIDARLDGRHMYTQVPSFSSGDRGIIDLLGVTREGRLSILELKASEDIHLVMQAVDYWLHVRWHHEQDDFRRYGYFPEIQLSDKPPLLFLVAPGFQFHPSMDIVLRYLKPEIEIARIALAENWRSGLRVVFRQ